ncbi:CheR family methyltransferase [Novipirellula rosea]|uniref:CheR family methyltransferase n=1 Tax=Novipirellula rosea TaxID=1031540 RepID=UPI0031E987AA
MKINRVADYVERLEEVEALFRNLLIGVTAFFREPDAFVTLAQLVLSKILNDRAADSCVRIWTSGNANSSEACTLPILCRAIMETLDVAPGVKFFATDIDGRSLRMALIPCELSVENVTLSKPEKMPLSLRDPTLPERLMVVKFSPMENAFCSSLASMHVLMGMNGTTGNPYDK